MAIIISFMLGAILGALFGFFATAIIVAGSDGK
jgi:uncharacterized membrane protein YoaK (UPF0700 family)